MKNIFLASFIILSFFSCSKNDDSTPPAVTINSPAEGSQYNVYDTISISFDCSDDKQLANYTVKLEDSNLAPVELAVVADLSGTTQTVTFQIVIDNIRIISGTHYIMVQISDGQNTQTAFRTVNITGIPKTMKGIFAATHPVINSTTIYKSDTATWTPSVFTSTFSDFFDLDVSSYWQQVIFNGEYNGAMQIMSIDGATAGWAANAIPGPSPYWGFLSTHDSRYWVSVPGISKLRSYDQVGRLMGTYDPDNNYNFKRTLQIGNKVYTEQQLSTGSAENLVVYAVQGGALQESPISGTAVSMFEKSATEVYVLSNNAGQGELNIYDYNTNGFWSPITLANGATVLAAAQIDSETLLIAMSNGNVYKFTYSPVGLLVQTSGILPSQMEFDSNGARVVTSEATSIKVWDFPGFTLQHTINYPDTVKKFAMWYNH